MRAGRENDAALPGRARGAASVRIRRCLPCGQKRCRAARRIWVYRGKSSSTSALRIRGVSARRGTRSPSPVSTAAAFSPCPPAGRPAGSARTRPRDQSLGNPFLGDRPRLSPPLRPPKRRRRQAPARGLAAVCALSRPARNVKKRPCPLLVGHGRVDLEPKALADRTAVRERR